MRSSLSIAAVLLASMLAAPLLAEDAGQETPRTTADLIKQLDAASFSERQQASVALTEQGKAAIPDLEKAALGGIREVTTRAIAILKQHYQSDDTGLKEAAKESLERLAQSEASPAAAARAREVIQPKEAPADRNNVFGPRGVIGGAGGIRIIGGGNIQIQAGNGRNFQRISKKVANGVTEIEAEENGRTVKIVEDADGIKMEVTEKKDDKPVTEKYEAKDADDLKKKHPDAHKIYEQYNRGNAGNIQFNIRPAVPGIQPVPLPLPVPAAQRIRLRLAPDREKLKAAQQQLREASERVQKAIEQNDADAIEQAQAELKAATQSLHEAVRGPVEEAPAAVPGETEEAPRAEERADELAAEKAAEKAAAKAAQKAGQ